MAALRSAVRADPAGLAAGLRLPASTAAAALRADARAASAPTMPALERYTGVLYHALAVGSLSTGARSRAEEQVVVLSGLWGVVRGGDLLPDYRVPASGSVPGFGTVAAHWRPHLARALPLLVGEEGVLDLRSTDYLALWRPSPPVADQVLTVRVLAEGAAGGRRTAVSFYAKHVKGQVVRHVVSARQDASEPETAVREAAAALDLRVEWAAARVGGGRALDLIGRYP